MLPLQVHTLWLASLFGKMSGTRPNLRPQFSGMSSVMSNECKQDSSRVSDYIVLCDYAPEMSGTERGNTRSLGYSGDNGISQWNTEGNCRVMEHESENGCRKNKKRLGTNPVFRGRDSHCLRSSGGYVTSIFFFLQAKEKIIVFNHFICDIFLKHIIV